MELETERLLLRHWQDSDAESLYRYAKDPAVGPIAGWPAHTSVEDSLSIIHNVLSDPEIYAVVLKETGEPVGSVGIAQPGKGTAPMQAGEAEIGYWIGVPYWGRGLIPEAVRALLVRCFTVLGCHGVWCGYYDGNQKSKRAQEKCGFTYHHTTESTPSPMGDLRTEHFTYMTRAQWEQNTTRLVRELQPAEWDAALALVMRVFLEFEATDYGEAGVAEFQKSLADPAYLAMLRLYGAWEGGKLAGVMATRSGGSHIALFFVEAAFQRRGIGTALFRQVCRDCPDGQLTVNASPYAVPVYARLGFTATAQEQATNGLRYTPMVWKSQK